MRGLMSLPANTIGYIIALALFVTGGMIIGAYWFEFQTIPKENQTPEKATACDLAYFLSTWEDATVYPTIFNKTFLENWDSSKTGASLFEKGNRFFLPGSDFFVKISAGKNYTMYVPPESNVTFETCVRPLVPPETLREAEKSGVENLIDEFGEGSEERKYRERATTYNELHAICGLPTFVANGSKAKTGKMVVALTSNLATKIRGGIYQLETSNDTNVTIPLGKYPEGCLFDKGIAKKEMKFENLEDLRRWFLYTWRNVIDKAREVFNYVLGGLIPKTEDYCGFVWDWENQTDKFLLTVESSKPGKGGCILRTRIPMRIVNSTNLTKKLCKPRDIFLPVNFPEGGVPGHGRKYFFLRVEKMTNNPNSEEQAKNFCMRRCKTEGPPNPQFWLHPCEDWCDDGWNLLNEDCSAKPEPFCEFAQQQIYMYRHLPEGAIDIEYIVVDEQKLKEAGWNFGNVEEKDYYAYQSACSTWPQIFDCTTSKDCATTAHQSCIRKGMENSELKIECDSCENNLGSYCSPNYLENPSEVLVPPYYTCQNVSNYTAPSRNGSFSECLPEINISYGLLDEDGNLVVDSSGNPVKEIDCSEHPNEKIKWTINAIPLCCRMIGKMDVDDDGVEEKVCLGSTGHCPKMKFWSNLNVSNSYYLSEDKFYEMFKGNIQQQVCRNGVPYNNAEEAFLVAEYYAGNRKFKYVLNESRVTIET